MSDIIGFDITPDSGSTLRKVLKFNLKPCMEEFEGISAGASKVNKNKPIKFSQGSKCCKVGSLRSAKFAFMAFERKG